METVRQYLLFFSIKNFVLKFLVVPAVVLLFLIPLHLSAKVGEEVKDSAATDAMVDQEIQMQDSLEINSQKSYIYVTEGVTVFAFNNLSDNVEVVLKVSDKTKVRLPKIAKKNSIALQSDKKAQKEKKYQNKTPKTFYSDPLSDSEILFSKNYSGNLVFPSKHNSDSDIKYALYYLLQLKQYDVVFISYKSAFSSIQYHHNFSVRPPPFLS